MLKRNLRLLKPKHTKKHYPVSNIQGQKTSVKTRVNIQTRYSTSTTIEMDWHNAVKKPSSLLYLL